MRSSIENHCDLGIITGVSMLCLKKNIIRKFSDVSKVKFKPITRETILAYFEKVNPLDKAGAYAIQEYGGMIIESIEGSRDNIIGLPTEKTLEAIYIIQSELIPLTEWFSKYLEAN